MRFASHSTGAVLFALSTLFLHHSSGLPFADGDRGDRHEGAQTLAEDRNHSHGPSQGIHVGNERNLVVINHNSHPKTQWEPDDDPRQNRHAHEKSAVLQSRTSSASVKATKTPTINSKTSVPKKSTTSKASDLYSASDPGESDVADCKSKNRRAEQVRCTQRQPIVSPAMKEYETIADVDAPEYYDDDYSKTYTIWTSGKDKNGNVQVKQAVDVFALDAAGTGVGIYNAQNGIEKTNTNYQRMRCSAMLLGFFTEQTKKPASALRTIDILAISNDLTNDALDKALKLYSPSKYGSSDHPVHDDLGSDTVTFKSSAAKGTPEYNAYQTFLTEAPFGRMATEVVNNFEGTQSLKITQLDITHKSGNPRVRIMLST